MAKSNASGLLTSLDSLFTTQEQRDAAKRDVVLDLPLDQIGDFPNHPFKVRQDEAMMEMMESVQLHGVLVPGLVRQLADGSYQMVSGHRRKLASRLAGLNTLPCIVRDLTDDEAIIVMVDSNLQREKVLPSEKAFAYRMKLEAMRRQAGRPKGNLSPVETNLRTSALIAQGTGDSRAQVDRYIRLTYLLPEILMKFNERYPKEQVKLLETDSSQVVTKIIDHMVDVGFTGTVLEKKHCKYIPFYKDELIVITPNTEKYQVLHQNIEDISWISGECLIMREEGSGTRKEAGKQLRNAGINLDKLKIIASIENQETIKKSVKQGMGISIISRLAAEEEAKSGDLLTFPIPKADQGRDINLVYNKNYQMSKSAERFVKVVKEVYGIEE